MSMNYACNSINFLRKELYGFILMKTKPKEMIYKVAAFNMQAIHNHGSPTLYRFCKKTVTARQHALQCETCDEWQHRLSDTGKHVLSCIVKGLLL